MENLTMEKENYLYRKGDQTHISMKENTVRTLQKLRPKDCPFQDYSMFDLLMDWIKMYSWQWTSREISLIDYIEMIVGDEKVEVYKNAMITLLKI